MYVIIVGGGKVGAHLASLLLAGGEQVRLIEERREEIPALQRQLPVESVQQGSGTDPLVLETAGIRQAQVVAAVTGSDETNLVTASLARFEFGVKRVIARINDPRNAWMFTPKMGVDVALNQADILGHLIAEEMSLGEMMTLLKLRKGDYSLVEEKVHPRSRVAGLAVAGLSLPEECVLVAVIRERGLLMPRPELVLQAGDEVLAMVHGSRAASLARLLGPPE
jgi:trk system potassium uptake protein TrkA